jgi:inorganic pyrophosphatase
LVRAFFNDGCLIRAASGGVLPRSRLQGEANKYAFDLDLGAFRLKAVLPQGNVFPFDFGFIPSTKADDGDPLDLLVLLEDSVPMGCAISVRLIGN